MNLQSTSNSPALKPRSAGAAPAPSLPPHILLWTDADVFAGTERHVLQLATSLREQGLSAKIACPFPSPLAERAAALGIPVHTIQKGGGLDHFAIRALRKLLRTRQIDLIHAHNGRTMALAAVAIRLAGRGGLIATQHFVYPARTTKSGLKGAISKLAHRWIDADVDHHIAISKAVHQAMLDRGDAETSRITIIPNGIDLPDAASADARLAIRAKFGASSDTPLIACLARLQPEKDVPTLVEAMKIVASARPDARCLLVGEGDQDESLRQQIQALRLEPNVRLTGFRTDAQEILAASDVLVLPSPAEPFGLVLLEAMALRKPIVAINNAGPLEIVVDRVTGRLVPPRDPQSMADALLDLISHRSLARQYGDAGFARYADLYTAHRMATATADVYRATHTRKLAQRSLASRIFTGL